MQIYTFAHGNVLDYQPGLDQANRHGTFMVLLWLYVTKKMFMLLMNQASEIYTTKMQVATFDVA